MTQFNTTNSNTIIINGDAAGDSVVINFVGSVLGNVNFNNQVVLNGISSDQVLYNFVGGNNLSGGPTLQVNNNGNNNPTNQIYGDFLDPNGTIHVTNANLMGRVFGGDSQDMQIVSGDTINAPAVSVVPAPPSVLLALIGVGMCLLTRLARRRIPAVG